MMLVGKSLELARGRTERIIKERFSVLYMNNAKWVRLLNVLSEMGSSIIECQVKLVWDDIVRNLRVDENITFDFDYYTESMEAMVSGVPKGWYDYKEIEWIQFSNNGQDLEKIASRISAAGLFEIELRTEGLRLYAYK